MLTARRLPTQAADAEKISISWLMDAEICENCRSFALLPMLFVSGLMGPYMAPIPINASAAMIFSFFVALLITPWLMVKIAGNAGEHAHGAEDSETRLGRAYRSIAGWVVKSRARAWTFLIGAGVMTLVIMMMISKFI